MSMQKSYTLLFITTLCTGCFKPPVAEKMPTYTIENNWKHEASTQTECALTHENWWEIFQDHCLNELIEKGIKQSPTLEKAFARFDEASWFTREVGADQFPQLSMNANGERLRVPQSLRTQTQVPTSKVTVPTIPLPNPPPTTPIIVPATPQMTTVMSPKFVNDLVANFLVTYEVDFWGKFYLRTQAAKARAEASQEDIEAARLLLIDEIASTYFTVQAFEKELFFIKEEIALHKKRLQLLAEQYEQGLTNQFLLLQERTTLETRLSDEQALLRTRENNLSLLAVLIGEEPNSASIKVAPAAWTFPIVPAGLPSSLLAKRPDIRSAMKQVDAIISEIGAAKTELLPTLSLSASVGYESLKANNWFKWRNRMWSLAGSLSQPIFDAHRRLSRIEETKAQFRQAAATLTDTVLSSVKEVEDALVLIRTQEERTTAAKNREKDLTLIAELRSDLYTKGVQDYINVLQAEEDVFLAKRNTINEEFNLQLGTLALIKSLGGSWETNTTAPSTNEKQA